MHLLDMAHWSMVAALKDQGTLSAAASSLGVTQSAATQRLREAERRLGVSLARKHGRTLVLTEAGQTLASAAGSALPALKQAESDAIWQGKRNAKQLTLALSHFDSPEMSSRLINVCQTALPDHSIQIMRMTSEGVSGAISEGMADIALVPGNPGRSALTTLAAAKDRLVAIFPPGTGPTAAELAQPLNFSALPFLTYDLRPEPGWEYDRFFNRGKSFPGQAVKIESTELICRMVSDGRGASILPSLCVAMSSHVQGLEVSELAAEPILFEWHLLHRPETSLKVLEQLSEAVAGWPLGVA
ncbi:LysR family transcriptional regulator [Roseibium sp. HPY-6]|uniref:LysR family transcriptional regulator n=1 Tax=Roseibium sp. HPY-6 TaxID=3229852 RepID=UPI00338F888C